jgi:division protein CdvB (Snf7/Vps24/ESCRT-III family)
MLQAELDKINKFYMNTEAAYQRQAASLAAQITRLQVKAARRRMGRLEKRDYERANKRLRTG